MTRAYVIALLAIAGCASAPERPAAERYARLQWAQGSVEQAEAECYQHINSAAGFGSSLYLCMRAKGWQER